MDDAADKENPPADFNKIDLTQLQGFSFGTQWTQDKSGASGKSDRGERPRREAFQGETPNRKDRRSFQRPMGGPGGGTGQGGDGYRPGGQGGGGPREGAGDYRGGARSGDPRRQGQGPGPGGDAFNRRRPLESAPYVSPYFSATFYPEDTSFGALVKTIRASSRTIELFEIAKTVLAKPDRFTVLVGRKVPDGEFSSRRGAPEGAAPAPAPAAPAAAPAAAKPVLFISVPDNLPFESEEAAVSHVLKNHLGLFFDQAETEVEPPKGNFQVVNRCSVTGELLGPPNYHRYSQTVQQHFTEKISRMSLEAYRSRIESVRDPEVIAQWLEKMKKVTRYTWKTGAPAKAPEAGSRSHHCRGRGRRAGRGRAAEAPHAGPRRCRRPGARAEATPVPVEAAPAPAETPAPAEAAAPAGPAFDSIEEAKTHLLTQARDKVVRPGATARFHGRTLESIPSDEIRRAVEGELERQRRFPLDTANALRGRLRREHFTIFKKGSKGVSYVCAVKRKFRVPGQVFADNIGSLINFVEANPMLRASELPEKFLGIAMPAAPAEGQPAAEAALTPEQRDKIGRLQGDLRWLVREGYVTEFIDGTLYAPPPVVEARKKEIEAEEQDPENFPEAAAVSHEEPPAPEAAVPASDPVAEGTPVTEPEPTGPAA